MKKHSHSFDVVVCGGGLAGFCAAVAAARLGAKTCLVHDRPVFGGNSSSEVRVTPHGAANFHAFARETGIIHELLVEERARNHEKILETGWTNSVWDMVLYDMAASTEGLTFFLNTTVTGVTMRGDAKPTTESAEPSGAFGYAHRAACNTSREIESVTARVANQETELTLSARTFIDCTGDALVAHLAGCEWRMGSEGREECDEPHAPAEPSRDTMGNSLLIRARDIGKPAPFTAPEWAVPYRDPDFFYKQGRRPDNPEGGYWWIEIGIPWDTLHQNETIRHELTRHALGVWNWMKNIDPDYREKCSHYALDWIGQVPGKRETRRVIGRYFMTEHDVVKKTVFDDEVAYGGWFIDLHTPGGLLAATSEFGAAEGYSENTEYAVKSFVGPYGIPLRSLVAKDIDNLLLAGRNISATHAALGTARVMATTALMGQAVGTASVIALRRGVAASGLSGEAVSEVQQQLLRDGCFLPNVYHRDASDFARQARIEASSEDLLYGATPDEETEISPFVSSWKTTLNGALLSRIGQPIALGKDRIDTLSVCLTNLSDTPQQVEVWLRTIASIWDYRSDAPILLAATLSVPPGGPHWIDWPVRLTGLSSRGWVRLDVGPSSVVRWDSSLTLLPGHAAMSEIGRGTMKRHRSGQTMSFRITPPQPVWQGLNAVSGQNRPNGFTNLWRSDEKQPLPAWIDLAWPEPVPVGTVQLTFPGQTEYRYHDYPPFYRDPQTACDYRLWDRSEGKERLLLEVTGNYQPRRVHRLEGTPRLSTLRLEILSTHGAPRASVYEIRCMNA